MQAPLTPPSIELEYPAQRERTWRAVAALESAEEDIAQLCAFFVANLLVHFPLFTQQDVGDYWHMIRNGKRLLTYSMASVAARFVPGCRDIQATLLPCVLEGLEHYLYSSGDDVEQEAMRWTAVQAVAVLYHWTIPQDLVSHHGHAESDASQLDLDVLTALWEKLANRCLLHRSFEEVANLLEHNRHHYSHSDIRQTIPFRKYLWWLWMFTRAHTRALLTPSVPFPAVDLSIYSSVHLLRDYLEDECVRPIVAQVELCLIWSRSPLLLERSRLGDYWWNDCRVPAAEHHHMDGDNDNEDTLAVLRDTDESLTRWHRTWCCSPDAASSGLGEFWTEFSYLFMRFCASVYPTNLHQSQSALQQPPSDNPPPTLKPLELIGGTVDRVYELCATLLNLSPLARYSLCFAPEDTLAMAGLGCEYVLGTRQKLSSTRLIHLVQPHHLSAIRSTAEVMVQAGVYDKHRSQAYGQRLLHRLAFPQETGVWTW
jgi:hypothetical protein